MLKDRESKFGERGSPAEVAMQKAKKAAIALNEEATLEFKRAKEIGDEENLTKTQHNAIGLAYKAAANSIESTLEQLSEDVEETLTWPLRPDPQS